MMTDDRARVEGELKPCPWCGNALTMRRSVNPYGRCMTPDCFGNRCPTVSLDNLEAVAQWNARTPEPSSRVEADEDETYEIGKRDGYSDAVQRIDQLTGGDGEYRYCTDHDPERHCPGPAEMIERIVERFTPTAAVLAEREACADLARDYASFAKARGWHEAKETAELIEAAIRARSISEEG